MDSIVVGSRPSEARLPERAQSLCVFGRCLRLLLPCLLLVNSATVAWAADASPLDARVTQALAQQKAEERLSQLAKIGADATLTDVPELLARAARLGELRERAVLHEAIIRRWSDLAAVPAFEHVAAQPESRSKIDLIRSVAAAFARHDPAQAAAAAGNSAGARSRIEALAIVAEVWAKADVPAAVRWARAMPPGAAQDAALYNIRFVWVHADPATAAEDLPNVAPGDTRNALLMNIGGAWAARDPQQAIAWARSLPDPNEQAIASFNIAESWADTDPQAGGAFALSLPPGVRERAAVAVAARWATQDPTAAAQWVLAAADDGILQRGLVEIMNVWTSVDPEAAEKWIAKQDVPMAREAAVQAFVEATLEWAPAAAAAAALAHSDPAQRWPRVESCLARWSEFDVSAARTWLALADLPAADKQAWLDAHPVR